MYALLEFLAGAVVISLSGVMAPGPVTTAALAAGARQRHAGALMALGHAVVEFPLMLLIIGGMGKLFESEKIKIGIGLAGGAFLIFLAGWCMKFLTLRHKRSSRGKPILQEE